MSLLNANSYQKGGWVLHMLRRELGDSLFKKSIRKYYETFAGKNAETNDLQRIVESVSGKNLKQFFQQWLFTSENPKLGIGWKYDAQKKQAVIAVDQQQKNIFSMPLDIKLMSSSGKEIKKIRLNITKQKEEFRFAVAEAISLVEADPDIFLLADLSVRPIK
jgi:aminopeptidase N